MNEHDEELNIFITNAIREDLGEGDHTSMACVPAQVRKEAHLLIKDEGILAGLDLARLIFKYGDADLEFIPLMSDGQHMKSGDIAFRIVGNARSILKCERLVLNCMQRMSGIASRTRTFVDLVSGYKCKILDTRKTTPGFRAIEKWAVRIGGGVNHRFGLYDMVMIKDNHIDFAGGIENAIRDTVRYLENIGKSIKIEIEARDLPEVEEIVRVGMVNRIMLDNFNPEDLKKAVSLIGNKYETEASGGIDESTVEDYAKCGVDYISVGALTNRVYGLDMSLKAIA